VAAWLWNRQWAGSPAGPTWCLSTLHQCQQLLPPHLRNAPCLPSLSPACPSHLSSAAVLSSATDIRPDMRSRTGSLRPSTATHRRQLDTLVNVSRITNPFRAQIRTRVTTHVSYKLPLFSFEYIVDYLVLWVTNASKKNLEIYMSIDVLSITRCVLYILPETTNSLWNSLPERVVMSKSVAYFRHQVNKLHFCVYCGNGISRVFCSFFLYTVWYF